MNKYNKLIDEVIDKLNKLSPTISTWKIRDIVERINDFVSHEARFNNFKRINTWDLWEKPIKEIISELERLKEE